MSIKQTEIGHNLIKQRLHSDSPKTVTNVMYQIVHYRTTRGWKSHIPSGNAGNTHKNHSTKNRRVQPLNEKAEKECHNSP